MPCKRMKCADGHRVQSKDLVESSAQKASSISPARFRTALAKSRRILETVSIPSLDPSPSRRRPSSSSPSKAEKPAESEQEAVGEKRAAGPSPFTTPKKRFKYSSGVDISGLVKGSPGSPSSRHKHEPAAASPLRHSVTPSSRKPRGSKGKERDDGDGTNVDDADDGYGDEDDPMAVAGDGKTPTKRVKYAVRPGVDLDTATEDLPDETPRTRRSRLDTSAFFALRPGSASDAVTPNGERSTPRKGKYIPVEDGLPEVRPPRRSRPETETKAEKRRKRDWTYSEPVWGMVTEDDKLAVRNVGLFGLQCRVKLMSSQLFEKLPDWLNTQGRPSIAQTEMRGTTVEDILLSG